MRWQFKVLIAVFFGFVGLELLSGQPIQLPGVGSLAGLLGKEGRTDPLGLLRDSKVKKELKLNEDQGAKVDIAVWKALAEVLTPEQLRRLKEIDLQLRGFKAFGDPNIQAELNLTASQKEEINLAVAEAEREVDRMIKSMNDTSPQNLQILINQIQNFRKDTKETLIGVLTSEQKRIWVEMLGEAFEVEGGGIKIDTTPVPMKKGKNTAKAKKGGG